MRESWLVAGNSQEDMRRTADGILDELIRSQAAGAVEACRRLAASDTTREEKRLLVRELLRSSSERP